MPRLQVRPPREADRARFVQLFCDDCFMVFSGRLTDEAANRRFDHMVAMCEEVPFAKQPVFERGPRRGHHRRAESPAAEHLMGHSWPDFFA